MFSSRNLRLVNVDRQLWLCARLRRNKQGRLVKTMHFGISAANGMLDLRRIHKLDMAIDCVVYPLRDSASVIDFIGDWRNVADCCCCSKSSYSTC